MTMKSNRWQMRPQADGTNAYIYVPVGTSTFTMKSSPEFNRQLGEIAQKWDGDWSKAEIVRELVAREAGEPRDIEIVALKCLQPAVKSSGDREWGGKQIQTKKAPTKDPEDEYTEWLLEVRAPQLRELYPGIGPEKIDAMGRKEWAEQKRGGR